MHGVPDRLVVLPGNKVGFAEIKRPGETPRKLQEKQIAFLKKLGCYTMVLDCEEDINAFLVGLEMFGERRYKNQNERNI